MALPGTSVAHEVEALDKQLADVRVIEATPDTAIVTYRASAQRAGEERYEARMSSTYARRDGRWRLGLHQQTPTPSGR